MASGELSAPLGKACLSIVEVPLNKQFAIDLANTSSHLLLLIMPSIYQKSRRQVKINVNYKLIINSPHTTPEVIPWTDDDFLPDLLVLHQQCPA